MVNFSQYGYICSQHFRDFHSLRIPEYYYFVSEKLFPKKKTNTNNRYRIYWWDQELSELVHQRKLVFQAYLENPAQTEFVEAKKIRALVRKKIKEKKILHPILQPTQRKVRRRTLEIYE